MKLSSPLTALVPLDVVTVTSTNAVPATAAGATAVSTVSDTSVKEVAGVAPKFTAVAVVKPLPPTVTIVLPVFASEAGETDVTLIACVVTTGAVNVTVAVAVMSTLLVV